MDLVGTKIVVLVLLGVIRLVFGLLPLKITKRLHSWGEKHSGSRLLVQKRRLQIERGLSLCLCFGGGVLLATCFIHMLPEAREALEAAEKAGFSLLSSAPNFPFAELFLCTGFFFVYIIEEAAHRFVMHHQAATTAAGAAADATSTNANLESTGSGDSSVPSEETTDVPTPAPAPAPVVPAPAPVSTEKPPLPPMPPPPPPSDTDAPPPPPQCCATVEAEYHKMDALAAVGDMERNQWSRPRSTSKIAPATSQVHLFSSSLSLEHKDPSSDVHLHHHHLHVHHPHLHHHHHHHPHLHPHIHHHHHIPISTGDTTKMGHLRSLIVVLALSFHSVFEGLAIGLQTTSRDVWYLFAAVSIHASAILFCVGMELVMSSMRLLNMVSYLSVLALVSPLGVALGVVATCAGGGEDSKEEAVIGGIAATSGQAFAIGLLQAAAGGTILYITFFEVLQREKRRTDSAGPMRLMCVLVGFAVMVALQVIGGHEHSGQSDHIDVGSSTLTLLLFCLPKLGNFYSPIVIMLYDIKEEMR